MIESEKEIKEETDEKKFKKIIDEKELIEIKGFLNKIKISLEKKMEDKIEELVKLKQDLPHLIHLKRINKIEQERRNDS